MRKRYHRLWFSLGRFTFKSLTTYLFSQMKYGKKLTKTMLKIIEYREEENITV